MFLTILPGNAYAHALRAYLLRATNQTYDAGLARARASRLSIGGTFENCFPPLEPLYTNGYQNQPTAFTPPLASPTPAPQPEPVPASPRQQEQLQTWTRTPQQSQVIRTRFWLSQRPRFVTFVIIGLNVLVYLLTGLLGRDIGQPSLDTMVAMGAQVNILVTQGQIWRLFTAMFLHFDFLHIALNMLSLYFVGSAVELFYGKWRYLLIYLVAGLAGSLTMYFALGTGNATTVIAGASGAVFGAFGALGAFYLVNRRALGPAGNGLLVQWSIWLLLNLLYGFSGGIAWQDHLGGLAVGLILGVILIPPLRRAGRRIV